MNTGGNCLPPVVYDDEYALRSIPVQFKRLPSRFIHGKTYHDIGLVGCGQLQRIQGGLLRHGYGDDLRLLHIPCRDVEGTAMAELPVRTIAADPVVPISK